MPRWAIFKFKIQKAAVQEIGHLIQQLLGVHQSNHLPWCKLTHMKYDIEFPKISDYCKVSIKGFKPKHKQTKKKAAFFFFFWKTATLERDTQTLI